jgi:hypothetical protein
MWPIQVPDRSTGSIKEIALSLAQTLLREPTARTLPTTFPQVSSSTPFAFARPVVPAGQPIPSSGGAGMAGVAGFDIGNVPRNCLRGPRQINTDFGLAKFFPLRESKSIEVSAEFFNLFNQVNLANPLSNFNAVSGTGGSINAATGQVINPGNFGRIISTSNNPRIIQFAVKFNF